MNGRILYQVTTPYACAGIEVDYATHIVVRAAPILGWMYGKHLNIVRQWCARKYFTLSEVPETKP